MPTLKIIFSSSIGLKQIKYPPKNWKDLKFTLSRDKTYKGIGRKITSEFEFVKDARTYLRDLYYAEGIDAKLNVEIYLGNDSGWNQMEWLGSYKGDFSEFILTETSAKIKFLDSEFETKLNNRDGNDINVIGLTSIDGNEIEGDEEPLTTCNLHDRTILLKNKHIIDPDIFPTIDGYTFSLVSVVNAGTPLCLKSVYVSNQDVNQVTSNPAAIGIPYEETYISESLFISDLTKDSIFYFNINLNFRLYAITTYNITRIYLKLRKINLDTMQSAGVIHSEFLIELPADIDYEHRQYFLVNHTATWGSECEAGYGYVIELDYEQSGAGVPNIDCQFDETYGTSEIFTENTDYYKQTTPQIMLPHECGERLLQLITGVQSPLYAPVFGRLDNGYTSDGELAYLAKFNGYMIREFTYADHPINISFKDWFKSYSCITPLAATIENNMGEARMRIDKIENILDASKVSLTISQISDIEIMPITEEYYSLLKFGYNDVTHEELTGVYSFNGELNFSTPIDNINTEFDRISKISGDDISIAYAQRKPYSDYPTEDTNYDDDIFFIDCAKSDEYIYSKKNEEFEVATGILAPEKAYNLNISPMRNLLRHKRVLANGLYRKRDKKIKFTKGAKNSNLVTKRYNENFTVYENSDYEINDLGTPYLLPNFIKFKAKITIDEFRLINLNPNYLIEVTIDKIKVYGFIDELDYSVITNEAQFKLIQSNR